MTEGNAICCSGLCYAWNKILVPSPSHKNKARLNLDSLTRPLSLPSPQQSAFDQKLCTTFQSNSVQAHTLRALGTHKREGNGDPYKGEALGRPFRSLPPDDDRAFRWIVLVVTLCHQNMGHKKAPTSRPMGAPPAAAVAPVRAYAFS